MVKQRLTCRVEEAGVPGARRLLPPTASVGQRWRFRRNLVIFVAYRNGVSQRVLAEVFDLPRSRIGAIIKQLNDRDESADIPI